MKLSKKMMKNFSEMNLKILENFRVLEMNFWLFSTIGLFILADSRLSNSFIQKTSPILRLIFHKIFMQSGSLAWKGQSKVWIILSTNGQFLNSDPISRRDQWQKSMTLISRLRSTRKSLSYISHRTSWLSLQFVSFQLFV